MRFVATTRITAWQRGTDTRLNGKEVGDGDKFQYDAEGQLTDAWYLAQDPGGNMHSPLVQEHFKYDQLGNRFGANQTVSYGVIDFLRRDNRLNQYASWTPSVIYHDDNFPGWGPPGNGVLMADGFITASYNALNQPRAIWSPTYAGTPNYVWFGFDPLGRCVKRWVGPVGPDGGAPPANSNPATYFLYDGWNMIEEGPGGGGVTRVYAHGARVDEIIASSNEFGAVLFHHYDALGNCILLSDGAGNLSEQYDYEAFGKPYFYNTVGTNIPESPWKNRYLGKGREWLSDLKLYDYRHRLYQPELGRFLQPDPIGFGGEAAKQLAFALGSPKEVTPPLDYNLYRYCHNDPINKSDPTGLHDVNVFSRNEDIKDYADASRLSREVFTIAGHGEPGGMIDSRKNELPATKLAELVRENSKFKEGMTVRLDACRTGVDIGDGSLPYAQQLANALNSPVKAPTTDVIFHDGGKVTLPEGGRYITFRPEKK